MAAEERANMIAGIPHDEYLEMLDDPIRMGECAAQMCPEGYSIGLEIGTIKARIAGLRGAPELDRDAWDESHEEDPEGRAWQLLNETAAKEDSDKWEWAIRAISFGIDAGLRQPMGDHKTEGVQE